MNKDNNNEKVFLIYNVAGLSLHALFKLKSLDHGTYIGW